MMSFLNILFNSFLGPVDMNSLIQSFNLMLKGMFGIFVVMFIIYLLIVFLGKMFKDNVDK